MLLNLRVDSHHQTALRIQDNKEIDTILNKIADRQVKDRDQAAQKVLITQRNSQLTHRAFHRILLNPRLHLSTSRVVRQPDPKRTYQEEKVLNIRVDPILHLATGSWA